MAEVKKVLKEEVEVLASVLGDDADGNQVLFVSGSKAFVPASEVNSLVLNGSVRRLSGSGTPDEKLAEARVRLGQLEQRAIEMEKSASAAMSSAITVGSKEQQDEARKMVDAAIAARNDSINAAAALVKAEEAHAKAVEEAAAKKAAEDEARAKAAVDETTKKVAGPSEPATRSAGGRP